MYSFAVRTLISLAVNIEETRCKEENLLEFDIWSRRMRSNVHQVQQGQYENIDDCLYMFRPLLAIIRKHSQHYKEIIYTYERRLSLSPLKIETRLKY
jgi:hypothetical protein